jgi:hypothetical protein
MTPNCSIKILYGVMIFLIPPFFFPSFFFGVLHLAARHTLICRHWEVGADKRLQQVLRVLCLKKNMGGKWKK